MILGQPVPEPTNHVRVIKAEDVAAVEAEARHEYESKVAVPGELADRWWPTTKDMW